MPGKLDGERAGYFASAHVNGEGSGTGDGGLKALKELPTTDRSGWLFTPSTGLLTISHDRGPVSVVKSSR